MKIACSSASFAEPIAAGRLTQLEWLDVCANELELDGVVLGVAQFARTDDEYLAQLKKTATDLGLTIAACADDAAIGNVEPVLAIALALGAPLVVTSTPAAGDDPAAWGRLVDDLKFAASAAKRANVTLALRPVANTFCASGVDIKRVAKDVDSAWLRVAFDTSVLAGDDTASALLGKAAIAMHPLDAIEPLAALERFRGFVVLERAVRADGPIAFHRDLARFKRERLRQMERDDDHTAVCMLG